MTIRLAFIGAAGIPNRYGGFESFLEHCAPVFARLGIPTVVTCDANLYPNELGQDFHGVHREFINIPANGGASIAHDLVAFARVFHSSSHIIVLGVSGGPWFPLFRLACALTGKRLAVNIDGVEWRRTKFSRFKRLLLKVFDTLAQRFSHQVIYDSQGLQDFLLRSSLRKSSCIAYPGDHVQRLHDATQAAGTALTICRIEPENNLELLIEGFLISSFQEYTIVGNWSHSSYARALRASYANEPRLKLLDPIYDAGKLADIRERCAYYLHGHSVGGTNPSLVEMLFYDCQIACFDVSFNRYTAENCAKYFATSSQLAALLDAEDKSAASDSRTALRLRYSAEQIAQSYIQAIAR